MFNPFTYEMYLRVTFEIVVWIFDTFHNNLKIMNHLTHFLKESVVNVLLNISLSDIFLALLMPTRFHQNYQTASGF